MLLHPLSYQVHECPQSDIHALAKGACQVSSVVRTSKRDRKLKSNRQVLIVVFTIGLFVLSVCESFAQTDIMHLRTTELAYRTKKYGEWSKWSSWEKVNVLVTFDFDDQEVHIYSAAKQNYNIISASKTFTDSDGDSVLEMSCVDQNNARCMVRMIRPKSGAAPQLYIIYSDISFVYNLRNIG